MDKELKTAEEYADKEINKLIGHSIAKRRIKIKQLEAEIQKIKTGEVPPDETSTVSTPKSIISPYQGICTPTQITPYRVTRI